MKKLRIWYSNQQIRCKWCSSHQIPLNFEPTACQDNSSVYMFEGLQYDFLQTFTCSVYIQELFDSSDDDNNKAWSEDEEPQKRKPQHGRRNKSRMQNK